MTAHGHRPPLFPTDLGHRRRDSRRAREGLRPAPRGRLRRMHPAESQRALRFTRNLAATTLDVSSGVPDPAVAAGTRRMGMRAPAASLSPTRDAGAAVAAGLLVAAVVSPARRAEDGPQPSAFGSVA